jgi:hypothetical protein
MKTTFKLGQTLKSRHFKRINKSEKEAYYLVVQEEDKERKLVIQQINANRGVVPGTAYIPIFPDDDLGYIEIKASDLVNEEITIKETLFNDIVVGRAEHYLGDNEIIQFTSVGADLISNVEFEYHSTIEHSCKGPLYYEMHHKEMFLK